jgi:hypothetical protein
MTILRGTLRKPDNNQLINGWLDISVDRVVPLGTIGINSSANIAVPSTQRVLLVQGNFQVVLAPSTINGAVYTFELFEDLGSGNSKRIRLFQSTVPDQQFLEYSDLDSGSGIYLDSIDSRLTAIARRVVSEPDFWTTLSGYSFNNRGTYSSVALYRRGDMVSLDGSSYLWTKSSTGNTSVTDPLPWFPLATRGLPGTGTTGNTTAYGPSWVSQPDTPSRGAIYSKLETMATIAMLSGYISGTNATLQTPQIDMGTAPGTGQQNLTQSNAQAPNTAWVQSVLDVFRNRIPMAGALMPYAGTVAPPGWLLCQGQLLTRFTHTPLFTVCGTRYNTGGEAATDFRLPNPNSAGNLLTYIICTGQ